MRRLCGRGVGEYSMQTMPNCLKCGDAISEATRSKKYCSLRCSTLYLKARYRKVNRDKTNAYKRDYRQKGMRPITGDRRIAVVKYLGGECARCREKEQLDIHHFKPLRLGGENVVKNMVLFCKQCHRLWHTKFDNQFWIMKPAEKAKPVCAIMRSTP